MVYEKEGVAKFKMSRPVFSGGDELRSLVQYHCAQIIEPNYSVAPLRPVSALNLGESILHMEPGKILPHVPVGRQRFTVSEDLSLSIMCMYGQRRKYKHLFFQLASEFEPEDEQEPTNDVWKTLIQTGLAYDIAPGQEEIRVQCTDVVILNSKNRTKFEIAARVEPDGLFREEHQVILQAMKNVSNRRHLPDPAYNPTITLAYLDRDATQGEQYLLTQALLGEMPFRVSVGPVRSPMVC